MIEEYTVCCKYYRTHWMKAGKWGLFTRCYISTKGYNHGGDKCIYFNKYVFQEMYTCGSFKIDWIKYLTHKEHFEVI